MADSQDPPLLVSLARGGTEPPLEERFLAEGVSQL